MAEPLVLGIETSCDETGVGIVRGTTLLANVIASSMEEHARYGGVVPEVAARAHLEAMTPTLSAALEQAGVTLDEIDAVAVTAGPGLAGALMVGVGAAKALAVATGKPLYGVNHLVGHVGADVLRSDGSEIDLPTVALLVSGGHTSLLLVNDLVGTWSSSARRSTTPPARRSTRSRGSWGCRTRAGRRSTGRRRAATPPRSGSPAGSRCRRTWPRTGTTSRSPGSRPPSRGGSSAAATRARGPGRRRRRQLPRGRRRRAPHEGAARVRGHRGAPAPARRGRRGERPLRAVAEERCARAGVALRIPPFDLCTDNGAMIAAVGARLVAEGHAPSDLGIAADSTLPVTTVQV